MPGEVTSNRTQNDGILCLWMQKIGLKRDLRCIKPCKCGDGSYLKHGPPHPRGGGRIGNFRGSTNQKYGKCHELSRQSIQFVSFNPSHPGGFRRGGGGDWGSTFQKSGKFHELSRKLIIKKSPPPPPPPPKGGRSGNFSGSKQSKVREMSWTAEKSNKKIIPTPPHQGLGVLKGNIFKCHTFHELKKIDICG